jgi:hypothetical protein
MPSRMTINEHVSEFAGRKVEAFDEDSAVDPEVAVRLAVEYEDDASMADLLGKLAAAEGAGGLRALVIGPWAGEQFDTGADVVVDALVAHKDVFTSLTAVFIGDIICDECEVSWLHQADMAPLLAAYPRLEILRVRGGEDLAFSKLAHDRLRELTIEAGGLGADVVQAVGAARLPALEHLELWLGTSDYGGDATVADLAPILAGDRFPKLRHLGLRDSEISDEVAVAVAAAPVVRQLRTLDLSMGTLGDEGARALLASPLVRGLNRLDLHHCFLSEEVAAQLTKLPGVTVDVSDNGGADSEDRYVAVSE